MFTATWGDERLPDRFWEKTQIVPETSLYPGPCWIWTAGRFQKGYGCFALEGRRQRAHIVSFIALGGEIPLGLQLDHLCTIRSCVNTFHLEPVTSRENTLRGRSPELARQRMLSRTHCPQGHPYSGENLYIRSDGRGRECRACRRLRAMNTYYREKFAS